MQLYSASLFIDIHDYMKKCTHLLSLFPINTKLFLNFLFWFLKIYCNQANKKYIIKIIIVVKNSLFFKLSNKSKFNILRLYLEKRQNIKMVLAELGQKIGQALNKMASKSLLGDNDVK